MCNTPSSNNIELLLRSSFESGYTNASISLSQMIKQKGTVMNLHMGSVKLGENLPETEKYRKPESSLLLITTEIFGEVSGKNYLLLSTKEVEMLTSNIPGRSDLKEEFIKELDNILSAAVITKLSNALNKRMYGNVPQLIGIVTSHVEDLINDDFSEEMEEAFISSIYFTFENDAEIKPLFVWVLDKSTIEGPAATAAE